MVLVHYTPAKGRGRPSHARPYSREVERWCKPHRLHQLVAQESAGSARTSSKGDAARDDQFRVECRESSRARVESLESAWRRSGLGRRQFVVLGSIHQHEAGAVLAAIELDDIATNTSAAVVWRQASLRRRAANSSEPIATPPLAIVAASPATA